MITYSDGNGGSEITRAVPTSILKEISYHPSYHGALSGTEAERKLILDTADNSYLTRYSEARKMYILSVLNTNSGNDEVNLEHFNLSIKKEDDHDVYEVIGTEKKFGDITTLLDFYKSNPLSFHIDSIGEEVLTEEAIRKKAAITPGDTKFNGKCKLHVSQFFILYSEAELNGSSKDDKPYQTALSM